jgi:hypothetical protein
MSTPVQVNPNLSGEVPSNIGAPPGTNDPKSASEARQRFIAKAFAEGQLRTEEERIRLEKILDEWEAEPVLSMEEVYAQVDRTTSLEQIIAEMRREAESDTPSVGKLTP